MNMLVLTVVVCGHASHVHQEELPELFPHRAQRERFQRAAHQIIAGVQLDQGRHAVPERAPLCIGKCISQQTKIESKQIESNQIQKKGEEEQRKEIRIFTHCPVAPGSNHPP